MALMIGENPTHKRIGPSEGILFSDIRLHVGLALRGKNSLLFRQDIFGWLGMLSEDQISALESSRSLAKVRYLSDVPLKDNRHLRFVALLAEAYCKIGTGTLIVDQISERVWLPSEFSTLLDKNSNIDSAEVVKIDWSHAKQGWIGKTVGLKKIGMREVQTRECDKDQEQLVRTVLQDVVDQIWKARTMPESCEVEAFGDKFVVSFKYPKQGPSEVRILRYQATSS